MSLEAERLKRRFRKASELAEERRSRAQAYARKLAQDMGKADPALRTVIGFGSTFETWRAYRMDSDIDLAIEEGSSDALRRLKAELQQDYDFVKLNTQKNRLMTERVAMSSDRDEFLYAALGYTMHNLYNAFEGYFLRVTKFFENDVDQLTWHKALLERMTLDIEGIRPAVIDLDMSRRIEELRRSRHVFRNIYKSTLVPVKVELANQAAQNLAEDFKPWHERFIAFLDKLTAELDAE